MKREQPDRKDERFVLGDWFESVGEAVRTYPFRAGTDAAKIIHYDRRKVSKLPRDFNAAAKGASPLSRLDQASAGRHIYTVGEGGWENERAPARDYMLQRMKNLYTVCKRNGVGVVVHTPEPGIIQISLTPQTRPMLKPAPRPGPNARPRRPKFQM